jgi:hypothetical protein
MTNKANALAVSIKTFADTYAGEMFAKRVSSDVAHLSDNGFERKMGFDAGAGA